MARVPEGRRAGGRGTGVVASLGSILGPRAALAAVLLAVLPLYRALVPPFDARAALVTEAVNDHLRVLASQQPLEVQRGGIHQVKPWFEGRLDFAPVVAFEGDAEFKLEGGAVGYFLDRRAAVFVYRYRLHAITLLVFRADGISWPEQDLAHLGTVHASQAVSRGFNVVPVARGRSRLRARLRHRARRPGSSRAQDRRGLRSRSAPNPAAGLTLARPASFRFPRPGCRA